MYLTVRVSNLPLPTILQLDFETVWKEWYILVSTLFINCLERALTSYVEYVSDNNKHDEIVQ